jgi:hypothetical protein
VSRAADTEEREAVEREGPDGGREALVTLLCERERETVERESSACARGRAAPKGVAPDVQLGFHLVYSLGLEMIAGWARFSETGLIK